MPIRPGAAVSRYAQSAGKRSSSVCFSLGAPIYVPVDVASDGSTVSLFAGLLLSTMTTDVDSGRSLDDLVAQEADKIANALTARALTARTEEEIRIEVERQLAFLTSSAGISLEGRHEFTIARGRADSVYSRVIIEYKNPQSPADRIGPQLDSPGTRKVVEQIQSRFYGLRQDQRQPLNSLFGVGTDGRSFIFVRFRDDQWYIQQPAPVNRISTQRFL
jgi:hypothetical protein